MRPASTILATLLIAGAGALHFPAPASAADAFEVLQSSPRYRTFVRLAKASGMDLTLMSRPGITVFVPNDRAFASMGEGNIRALMQNPAAARRLVGCHVVGESLRAGDLYDRTVKKKGSVRVRTLGGCALNVTGKDRQLFVNGRPVVKSNQRADNGLVQEINGVLR